MWLSMDIKTLFKRDSKLILVNYKDGEGIYNV